MKRRSLPAAVLAVSALVFTTTAWADDLKAMEGTWKVEAAEVEGKPVESDDVKAIVLTIAGERYDVTTKDGKDAGTLKLDETQKPKTMDVTDTEGFDAGKVTKAIYELSGNTLRVCYALVGSERPKELVTTKDSPWLLVTYTREKKAQ